ncbi:CDP-diacylglycerol--serine O-phosphatidyltransferase [bacterium]|nr:CDP-diacylglycerol--serine O-phosphatidyltransferase [bacterium]
MRVRAKRRSTRPRLRKVYLLPNLFTALNLFLGLFAIYSVFEGRVVTACWFIVFAGILDGLDGLVARLTHTQSAFGVQFDSLSDLVSFGVSPSVVAFYTMQRMGDEHRGLLIGVCSLYAICGALRLARYNIQAHDAETKGFMGLPIPGAALGLVFSILLIRLYGLDTSHLIVVPLGDRSLLLGELVSSLMPFLVLALALLMVSEVHYPKPMSKLRLGRRMSFDTLVTLIVLALLLVALSSDLRVAVGFGLLWFYIIYGPVIHFYRMAQQEEEEDKEMVEHDTED